MTLREPAEQTKSDASRGQRGQLAGRRSTTQRKETDSQVEEERTEATNTEARVTAYTVRGSLFVLIAVQHATQGHIWPRGKIALSFSIDHDESWIGLFYFIEIPLSQYDYLLRNEFGGVDLRNQIGIATREVTT